MAREVAAYNASWNYPTPTRFGIGRINDLPAACAELGMKKPLLITDPVLVDLPITSDALGINAKAGMKTEVFADIKPNPVGENVDTGVKAYKAGGHDGVIAFGGGSALDAAKAIALMVGQTRPLWDFEDVDDWFTRVNVEGMAPVVAVPTTSGTGSEVGRSSIITHSGEHKKKVIFHPRMLPGRVICDPALTAGMPPKLTGAVGMDALSHNLEAYCTTFFHPMGQGIALEGMRLVHRSLLTAYDKGGDLAARADMMAASSMGATAFQKGLGAMHAVGHAIGGLFDTHHGTTVACMMPYVLVFNRSAVEGKLTALARYLDLPTPGFQAALDWVVDLRAKVGIPHSLEELGVKADALDELAERAVKDPTAGGNPVALTLKNVRGLIDKAFHGALD